MGRFLFEKNLLHDSTIAKKYFDKEQIGSR